MSFNEKVIDAVITDPTTGAGNFVYKIHENIVNYDEPLIYLDQPFKTVEQRYVNHLTLKCIVEHAEHLAAFYHKLGIIPKELVVLYFDESINYFLFYVALTSLGAIPVFINSDLDEKIVLELCIHSNAKTLVTDNYRLKRIQQAFKKKEYAITLVDIDQVYLSHNEEKPKRYCHDDDDTVLLTHTSGTTGIPKLVQFTHSAMFYGVKKQIKKQAGHHILSALPHSHASSISILMSSLIRLVTLKIQVKKEPVELLKTIENDKPDLVVAFPKVFVDLARCDLKAYNLASIQYWLSTGDANHEPHIRRLMEYGHHWKNGKQMEGSIFIDNLGSSEFSFAMFRNLHTPTSNHYDRCIGVPFEWVACAILSEEGSVLPANQIGYLGVRSKSVTKGYWNNSYLTEKNRLGGFWLTGDLAYRDENGFFYHVDRITDKIKTADGFFYTCQAEEWILKNISFIFDITFVGFRNKNGDVEIIAIVELKKDYVKMDLSILKNEINYYLIQKKLPVITQIQHQTGNEDTGVTGKKLKKRIQQNLENQVAI